MKYPIITFLLISFCMVSCKTETAVDDIAESRINTEASVNEMKVM